MPATKTKSPALAPRLQVPSVLIAPGGLSVLTPFGEGACAKPTLDAMASAVMQAKTRRGHIWALHGEKAACIGGRFSNRALWVKPLQALPRCVGDVARGLALLFGLGTKALPSWDSKTRWNNLLVDLA